LVLFQTNLTLYFLIASDSTDLLRTNVMHQALFRCERTCSGSSVKVFIYYTENHRGNHRDSQRLQQP